MRDGAGLDFSEAPCSEVVDQDGRSAARLWRNLSRRACVATRSLVFPGVFWGLIDVDPAKLGVDNPSPRRREQRPFESWAELDAVAAHLSPRYRRMMIFAAATGLRPAEWLARMP